MNPTKILTLLSFFIAGQLFAQDDLLNQLDTEKTASIDATAFKGLQICNMQSTKTPAKGEFYLLISHRFGDLTNGLDNFFGLDNAYTKIGGIYGATDWLSFGLSRHTFNKTYEMAVKYRFANQKDGGFPFTLAGYHTMDVNTKLSTDEFPNLKGTDRFAYSSQLLIARKFSESFSFELAGIYVHKNLYEVTTERKDNFTLGAGGRYKISKRVSINAEYGARLNAVEQTAFHDPISVGVDIDTGGHIFQMVFSNCQQMNDAWVFTNTGGNWDGGGIFFGFNMYRVF